jgi:hypothetical protein
LLKQIIIEMRKFCRVVIICGLGFFTLTACDSKDSYVKVKNKTNSKFKDVIWDSAVVLGNISPGKEHGVETSNYGKGPVYLLIENRKYESTKEIEVDASSSATLVIDDTSELIEIKY